jgi:hypothetical protein
MTFVITSVVIATGTAAYSAKQQRKAQKRAEENAQTRALIEGSAPNIAMVKEIVPEEVQGSDVAGLEAALDAMDYEGGQPPIPGAPEQGVIPTDMSEEELMMMLEQQGGLEGLLPQAMADGGPVGTPGDVYYFGVPQIMGMMQDPDPQIQQVGMQLADQMEMTPDAGMVPATQQQIQTMANGGAVTAKKFSNGGITDDELQRRAGLDPLQELERLRGSTKRDLLSSLGLPEDFGERNREDVLFSELMDRLDLPVDIQKEGDEYSMSKIFGDEDSSLRLGASTNRGDPQIRLDFQKRFAEGGAVTAKKLEMGGSPEYDQNLDAAFLYRSGLMEQLKEINTAVEEGLIGQTTADQDRQQIMAELLRSLNPDNFDRRDFIKNQLADEATSYERKALDRTLFKELSETRTRELLEDLQQFDSSQVDEYKGIFDESGIPNEQLPQAGQALTDKDLIDLATRPQLAEGGSITEDRLNQLRLR